MAQMTAGGIGLDPGLKDAISGYGTNAYNKIKGGYGQAQTNFGNDASARGMNAGAATGPGSYYGTQAPISQGLATGGLENALGGGLGNTSYNNALQQRDFEQNMDLARQTGALMKPDMLQQVLGGIGNVGGTAAGIYGAFGKNKAPQTPGGGGSSWDIMNPGKLDLGYGGF